MQKGSAVRYVMAFLSPVILFVGMTSLSPPSLLPVIIVAFLYLLLRWKIAGEEAMQCESRLALYGARGFILLCSLLIFAGISNVGHVGATGAQVIGTVIALGFAIEAARQVRRVIFTHQTESPP